MNQHFSFNFDIAGLGLRPRTRSAAPYANPTM